MLAAVATATQPRYSPKVPSSTTFSVSEAAGSPASRRISSPRVTTSARITTTLTHSQPAWVTSSQAPLRIIEIAASVPIRRAREELPLAGSHCQIT